MMVTLFGLVAMVGCSKSPTMSEPNQDVNILTRSPMAAAKVLGESAYDEVTIGVEGGYLKVLDVELFFPEKALNDNQLIFIDIPDIVVFENNFGTHGLVFNEPVKVIMSYRDADLSGVKEETITIAWQNDRTGGWEPVECQLDTVNKTVTAYLNHFSAYALISD
jgi:hypothetical protein